MDTIVQHSIAHDVDEPSFGMSPPSAGAEGGQQVVEGPTTKKISPRPWLMAPKNVALSRVALPVTAVTAAALLFYSRDSISAGAGAFDDIRLAQSQDTIRRFLTNARSNVADRLLATSFPSSPRSFAQFHSANPSWDRL